MPATPLATAAYSNERAGFGLRLGAYLLDSLLYGLLSLMLLVPGGVLIALSFRDCRTIEGEVVCPAGSPDVGMIAGGVALLIGGVLLVAFIYLRALGRTGQTWGRKILDIKVVGEATGQPIGFGRALGRELFANVISGQIFYLGYLWMLWDDKQQTWHDKVVGSIVVKT